MIHFIQTMQAANLKPLRIVFTSGLIVYGLSLFLFDAVPANWFHTDGLPPGSGKSSLQKKGTNGVSANACIVWDCDRGVNIQSWQREKGLTINRSISGYGAVCQSWAQCD